MKVLLVSTYDSDGGAARASYRILKSIQKFGVYARMVVGTKRTDDYTVFRASGKMRYLFPNLIQPLDNFALKFYKNRKIHFWNVGWVPNKSLVKEIQNFVPDILQLHWVSEGFFPVNTLAKVNMPIVWRLSDSWAFTGGCHVPFECMNYKTGCGHCPQLNSSQSNDLSRRTFKRKDKYWKNSNITIVAPSNWMADCAKQSALFANRRIVVIPPGINMNIFKPMHKPYVRKILQIPINKKIICFGAIFAIGDINKGFNLLHKALLQLKEKNSDDNVEIIIIGSSEPVDPPSFGFKCTYIGRVHDETLLALYYAAADIFVLPSLMENSPNTVIESMACGVPVVAFAAGGALDMISHLDNGYLATPYNVEDMANGIDWIINQTTPVAYQELSDKARAFAVKNYDIDLIGSEYKSLYENILNNN